MRWIAVAPVSLAAVCFAAVCFAAAARADRSVFMTRLKEVPVGFVTLETDGRDYRYRSVQTHPKGSTRERVERSAHCDAADAGAPAAAWESLWLLHRPPLGCVTVRQELEGGLGEVCVQAEGSSTRGTLYGRPFEARYVGNTLNELVIGESRFTAVKGPTPLSPPPDFLAHPLKLPSGDGALVLEPAPSPEPIELSPWSSGDPSALARAVHAEVGRREQSSCLDFARQFFYRALQSGQQAAVVYGWVAEKGGLHPHAWNRIRVSEREARDLDPTLLIPVKPTTHLAIAAVVDDAPPASVGEVYLDVLAGRRHASRARP